MLTTGVVVAVDCSRGSCEILETAIRWPVLGGAGDLSDEDVPDLVVRGGPAQPQGVAAFLHNTHLFTFKNIENIKRLLFLVHIYIY